jgi:hypothetical protein
MHQQLKYQNEDREYSMDLIQDFLP